jgi:ornithine cyclodeaminase/alanine dehydrogenase-like protein (mu-crystallin family)
VRQIKQTRVVSRRREHADAFATEMSESFPFPIEAVDTVQQAVEAPT